MSTPSTTSKAVASSKPSSSSTTKFIFQSPKLKQLFQEYKQQQSAAAKSSNSSSSHYSSSSNSGVCGENDFIVKTKTIQVSSTKSIQVLPSDHDIRKKVQKITVSKNQNIQNEEEQHQQRQQQPPKFQETHLLVVNMDTVNAALCLRKQQQQQFANTVCALSFANDQNPGGYYRTGARAQEEDLCRTIPELYDSLIVDNKKFYPLQEGEALLSQDLFALRKAGSNSYELIPELFSTDRKEDDSSSTSDKEEAEKSFFDSLPKISIITAAMPRGLGDKRPPGGFLNPQSEWNKTVTLRIRSVLTAAKISGKKDLVLGSFGCGAFNNPPKAVAQIFKDELTKNPEFVGCFERVVFAIIDPMGTGNLKPFLEILAS